MTEFLALYRGRTVSEAELIAICADPRIVHQFFEKLAAKPTEEGECGDLRGRVAKLRHGEHEE